MVFQPADELYGPLGEALGGVMDGASVRAA
jgi:hypothetical protein